MKTLKIHSELQTLLPPLTDEECKGLEADIVAHGCLSPLVTWDGTIVDGHNRYEICQKHGLPFETIELPFDSLEQAKLWAWQHQEHRRNMTSYQRTTLALKFKPMLVSKAKLKESERKMTLENSPKSPEINTRTEIAKIAGVSDNTVARVEYLEEHVDEDTKEKLRQGKTSVNKEYTRCKAQEKSPKKPKAKPSKKPAPVVVIETETDTSEYVPPPLIHQTGGFVQTVTLQHIPQDHPERLIACVFSLFSEQYTLDLIAGLVERLTHEHGGLEKAEQLVSKLYNQYFNTSFPRE
ncbi:MAG: hypothetical protein FWH27_11215 [Planctomycetaceae bacterium]|nr:hypothetical protein [Planctomycetaceae bacterium]